MLTFHPLHWPLIALVLAIVHPVTSHPIRTSKWIETTQFEDRDNRGVWKVFEKPSKYSLPELPQVRSIPPESPTKTRQDTNLERGQPGRLYKRDKTSDKSIVSVLVSNPPISERLYRQWKHPQAENYEYPWKTATRTKHFGEVLGHTKAKTGVTGFHRQGNDSSSPSLGLSSGNYISFVSYRISFPFLRFVPLSFPQFPLPDIFTTIMILLALVWIAILTVGLVEVGNFLWDRGRAAHLADESNEVESDDAAGRSVELVKEPFQVLIIPRVPRREAVRHQDEDEDLLSSSSGSDSEFESETNYRTP
ncbi:hypothetical protein N7486_001408 [Penicillium sp. IBT 16267x]|nr:hypothetical protein N7486_001408 [Penicillium sp. IBT 16267x]